MSTRAARTAIERLSLCLLLAVASAAGAAEPISITVSDTAAVPAGSERAVERTPTWPSEPVVAALESPGIRALASEGGITVFIEAFSVSGGTPTASDNDFTRVNVAFQALPVLGDGTAVELVGTFDWSEPNAFASWAAADYAVIPPPGVADITVRAASLGDAVIQGPGELPDPAIAYEGFLQLFGGTYQRWTIENLVVRGFDWPIGMYFSSGGSAVDFEGVVVRSNRIEMVVDTPGNSGTGTGEPLQNIGLHYAFGHNQTIQGNEFVIPGIGTNDGTNVSSSVAIQSNSSSGDVYDGLLIAGNTIRVSGAPVDGAERLYGIWENGAAHASNIEVSSNLFVNEAPDNDPATNLQRAFRVTSHSSATTAVVYADNLAAGANIGVHWIGDSYQSSPPATVEPVLVLANTLVDDHTAVWVHTDDLAPDPGGAPTNMSKALLRFNRIVGNGLGVRSDDAEVTAEDNWWGCNDGPGVGDCDDASHSGTAGFLDADPWLVLGLEPTPDVVPTGGQAIATADLRDNSNGVDTSPDGSVPDGIPVAFGATGGTIDPASTATLLGAASSVFTAGVVAGAFTISATVDLETADAPILVTAVASVSMTITPAVQILDDGGMAEVEITVANTGPEPGSAVAVSVDFPEDLFAVGWVCVGSGGGSCTAAGSGDITDSVDLPVGATATYTAVGTVPDPFTGILTVEGEASPPAFLIDPDPSDNGGTAEIRSLRIFSDGFESGDTAAWSVTVP